MLRVCLLGCGGVRPQPNRRLTGLVVKCYENTVLIDCGEGAQLAIREAGFSLCKIDTICITHLHSDHYAGLLGLLITISSDERREPITIIGPRGLKKVVNAILSLTQGLKYTINSVELSGSFAEIQLKSIRLKAFKLEHSLECYGFSVIADKPGSFDEQKAIANGIERSLWSPLCNGEVASKDGILIDKTSVLGPDRKGLKVVYCTDSRPIKSIVTNAKGADLFICEGMYDDERKLRQAKEKKHMLMSEAANLAREADVKEMWLTHFSPNMLRPQKALPRIRKIFPNTYLGFDGKTVDLQFEKRSKVNL